MIHNVVKSLLLAGALSLAVHGGASAAPAGATVSSQQQGMHQWSVLKGKLILVNGTYQDTTSYKRSLTFFFESKPGGEWLHVPVVDSASEQELTWFSISQGEQTVADAAVVARGDAVELVVAETKPGKSAPIAVRWYRLAESDDDNPDGPAYYFKKLSATSYPAKAKLTVEQVLKKETSSRSSK
ncbi:hypothetical protein [Massilia sp. YMA4]|uniref:hypothetical protein n=1 Tax=Massilia sp. YMA4 TaxID=1593482 RepID=UPI000DD0F7CF|nr:hypothetical protein [Massilia sp. YMA4]AXA90616.1 hypothetical protein DPH57_05155 [Massilia sp. YMA4]